MIFQELLKRDCIYSFTQDDEAQNNTKYRSKLFFKMQMKCKTNNTNVNKCTQ